MKKRKLSFFKKKVHDTDELEISRLLDNGTPFAIREAYSKLCTNLMYLPSDKHCKTIAITSALAGEGKTLLSANIATCLAQLIDSCKILLIDSDLRCSRINRLFETVDKNAHGLSEYLAGIDEVPNIHKSGKSDNLFIISAGAKTPNPAGLLSSSRLGQLIKKYEEEYDYIIIDTPPIDLVTDALLYSAHVSGYIISVRADYSNINLVNETIDQIHDVNGNVYGVVLNSVNPKYNRRGGYYSYNTYE